MIFQFRVTLPGIKGFYRIYKVNSANTFYEFHKQLQADLLFPADQPILFKALNETGQVLARYALLDLGFGAVDDVTTGSAVESGAKSFEYFYDIQSRKKIIITLEGSEDNNSVLVPTLDTNDIKGPEPAAFDNGYVAFEDMPPERRRLPGERNIDLEEDDDDDEDDEDDEEEDDDEDGKVIYSDNE